MSEKIEKPVRIGRPYRVLVIGGGYDYIRMLFDLGFNGANAPEKADFFLFTGGEDVDPTWYNEPRLQRTYSNIERDRREKVFFDYAVEHGVPMVGICRGGQFLNVMNGGRMWQHVEKHTGPHAIREVMAPKSKQEARTMLATSTHHQMMIPTKKATVLAVGIDDNGDPLCDLRISHGEEIQGKDGKKFPDFEVLYYPETSSLCFQPHPEFPNAPKECRDYFEELLTDYILPVTP